ncbi:hypothetical protein ACFX2B_014943 [Malus domestica]
MDSKKSNRIRDIVRLRQILKKWRKIANSSNAISGTTAATTATSSSKSIKFLKRTLLLPKKKTTTSFEASNNAAYEEHGWSPETNPFGNGAIRVFLRELKEC